MEEKERDECNALAISDQMFYNKSAMNPLERLRLLDAPLEQDGAPRACPTRTRPEGLPIHQAAVGGRRVPILKTLLTSACERDCAYCPFRAGRNFRRVTFRPDELVETIQALYRKGTIRGVLLSSGLAGGGRATQDRLLTTAHLLRQHGYRGYLHLKLMPGIEKDQVLEALRLADRVSINLEAPSARHLSRLAPHKWFWRELLQPLQWAAELRRSLDPRDYGRNRWPSLVTQFVVGAAQERDRDLLALTARLLRETNLARAYFSPFRPIADTPLAHHPPSPRERAHNLYRAFFLLRDYGFALEELVWDAGGNLPPEDPKKLWAEVHLRAQPVELNTAPRALLLRIPGIGPRRAEVLLRARRTARLRTSRQLQALGLPVTRMAPYILLDGRRLPRQAELFASKTAPLSA